MDEKRMVIEYDPDFIHLYILKSRTPEVTQEKNIFKTRRELERINLGNSELVKNPFSFKAGPIRRARSFEDATRSHDHEPTKIRPMEGEELVFGGERIEDFTQRRQGELPSQEVSALKSLNRNTLGNDKAFPLNPRLSYKITMLKEGSPAFMRLIYKISGLEVVIFDVGYNPVISRHYFKVHNNYQRIRYKIIKEITMKEITGKEDIKIPQIVSGGDEEIKFFLCPLKECDEGFMHPLVAKNHVLSHFDIRPFSCHFSGCSWTFNKDSHLQRHLATHENSKNYHCDEPGCGKLFTTIYNLNGHKKKRHIQPATKPCPVVSCKETFRNDKELRTHCKSHSDDDAPLKCDFPGCTRSFFFQIFLDAHMKTHLEQNQHICTYNNCNKSFQQAYRLKEHMRCHTGAKPYRCTIGKCFKGFTTASKLKRHEKSHFDDKNHYCTVEGCDKAFKRSDHLNYHIRQVHKGSDQGRQKGLEVPRPTPLRVDHTSESSLSQACAIPPRLCMGKLPQPSLELCSGPSSSGCNTTTSEDEDTDLSEYLGSNPGRSSMPNSSVSGSSKTEEELLDEAIKSLGVPELETDLFLDEPLDLTDFSTVNLRDLQ